MIKAAIGGECTRFYICRIFEEKYNSVNRAAKSKSEGFLMENQAMTSAPLMFKVVSAQLNKLIELNIFDSQIFNQVGEDGLLISANSG